VKGIRLQINTQHTGTSAESCFSEVAFRSPAVMILVTGGTGFIGSHLVERLVAQGRPLRCLVRRPHGRQPAAAVELAHGDLESGAGLAEALRGVDTVIHLAGVTKARTAADYDRGNAVATANLLRAAGHLDQIGRFVHVSSLAAAGPSPADRPLTETDEPHPVSHYGRSKLAGEQAVRQSPVAERSVIVRPPVVYGPRDRDVLQVLRTVARGWMAQIGAAPRRFSHIYVGDLVDGLIAAADCASARRTGFLSGQRRAGLLGRIRKCGGAPDGPQSAHGGDTGEGRLRPRAVRRVVGAP
jgi:dihydroflavonol-4-reductase